jgi:uncharacterized protein (TIGR03435 family)
MFHRVTFSINKDDTMKHTLCIAALAFVLTPIAAQIPPAQKRSFTVASVKPNKSGNQIGLPTASPGGRFSAINVWLPSLLQFAYRLRNGSLMRNQIMGGPSWMDTDRFDIQATAEADTGSEEMQLMVRSLLEDRFRLKAHVESRELPIYDLVVARDAPKIKLAEDQNPPTPGTTRQIATPGPGSIALTISNPAITLSDLVTLLQQYAGRPIVDKTNLRGLFDVKFQFSLDAGGPSVGTQLAPPPDPSGPSFFTAVQEQLGLRLAPARGPVEVLVIDSVEKPTDN